MTFLPIRLLSLHRWYIQAILLCYLLCPFAYLIIRKYQVRGLLLLILISIIVERILPEIKVWKFNWAFGRVPVFLIGMFIAEFDFKMSRIQYVISAGCLLVAAFFRCKGGSISWIWPYFLAAAMPFVCQILCKLRGLFIRIKLDRFIELCGLYSLEIYLVHEYCYWAFYNVDLPLALRYLLFIVAVPIICIMLKETTDYISSKLVKR